MNGRPHAPLQGKRVQSCCTHLTLFLTTWVGHVTEVLVTDMSLVIRIGLLSLSVCVCEGNKSSTLGFLPIITT